jgi:hypothetical protein
MTAPLLQLIDCLLASEQHRADLGFHGLLTLFHKLPSKIIVRFGPLLTLLSFSQTFTLDYLVSCRSGSLIDD